MSDTVLRVTHSDTGESLLISCNLTEASSPVTVDYGQGWECTPYQCADCSHRDSELAKLGMRLLAQGLELPCDESEYEVCAVEKKRWIELSDGSADDQYDCIEDAAEAALHWYDYLEDNREAYGKPDWTMPEIEEFDGEDIDELNSWIRSMEQDIALSRGGSDFAGHGHYYVTAADRGGYCLRASWVEADEWTEID